MSTAIYLIKNIIGSNKIIASWKMEIASWKRLIEYNIKSYNMICDIWPSKQLGLGMAVHGVQGEAWKRMAAGTKAHPDNAPLPDGEPEDAVSNI